MTNKNKIQLALTFGVVFGAVITLASSYANVHHSGLAATVIGCLGIATLGIALQGLSWLNDNEKEEEK